MVKQESQALISQRSNKITTIAVPVVNGQPTAEGFKRLEESEIRFQGKLYDVVSVQFKDGKAVFKCIPDDKETDIETAVNDQVQKQGDNNTKKKLSSQTSIVLFAYVEQNLQLANTSTQSTCCIIGHSEPIPVRYLNIPSPPPWRS